MRRISIALIFLAGSLCHAAIANRCSVAGNNPNGSSITQGVCGTTADGDYMLIGAVSASGATTNSAPYATPSGWTQLCTAGNFTVFGKFWHTGDSTSITVVNQNGATGFATSSEASYSGVNATTPVDGTKANCLYMNGQLGGVSTFNTYSRAPGVFPSWTTDEVVAFYFDFSSGGVTYTMPGTLSLRLANTAGPTSTIGDATLASAANTGNFDATCSCHLQHGAATVLLLPASGGASATPTIQPTFGGFAATNVGGSGSFNFGVGQGTNEGMYPQNNDMVVYCDVGATASGTTASGMTSIISITAGTCLYEIYTGGSTSVTVTCTGCGTHGFLMLIRNWQFAANSLNVAVDTSGSGTHVASGTSISTPTQSLKGTNDLAVTWWIGGASSTWTLDAALENDFGLGSGQWRAGSKQGPSNPTGTYTSTFGTTTSLDSLVVTFVLANGSSVQHRGDIL